MTQRQPIQIDHLNVDFINKAGKGNVQNMVYHIDQMTLEHKLLKADLEMKGDTLSITDGTTKFSISKTLDFINLFESIHAEELNFYLENSHFDGSIIKTFVGVQGNHFLLDQLKLACGSLTRDVGPTDDTLVLILEMCMGQSKVGFQEMTFPESSSLMKVIQDVADEALGTKAFVKLTRIHNFDLRFEEHRFSANARVKVGLDLGVHLNGNVEYQPDQLRYRIRIDHAALGFIPVRRLLFKQLAKLHEPNVTVHEPYIDLTYPPANPNPSPAKR